MDVVLSVVDVILQLRRAENYLLTVTGYDGGHKNTTKLSIVFFFNFGNNFSFSN